MTQSNYTHISFLLDRSGSMGPIWADAQGGFTAFVKSQKEAPGKATFSFSVFDSTYTPIRSFTNMADVPDTIPDDIYPRGMTALLDAIGRIVVETGAHIALLPEDQRPSKVVVVIYTDGEENSSHLYTEAKLRELITQQETVYSWDFVFLASNINAVATAATYGVQNLSRAADVHYKNIAYASALTGEKLATYRTTGDASVMSYTADELNALANAPKENQ